MGPKSEKPLRLFVNPFTIWTQLAFKTGEAMLASAHAAAVRAKAPKVAVLPTADAPPRKAQAPVRQASNAARSKATRAKVRSKAKAKRRAKR
jgi:hypothetical protein